MVVADDDPRTREALGRALSAAGMQVRLASTGKEAIDLARHFDVDVLVTDINMPGNFGLELLSVDLLKRQGTGVIIITGNATVSTAVSALRAKVHDYLTKPFDMEELVQSIHAARHKRQAEIAQQQLVEAAGAVSRLTNGQHDKPPSTGRRVSDRQLSLLSIREREVALLLCDGLKNDQVASRLSISPYTVRNHVRSIYSKLGIASQSELVLKLLSD